MMSSDDRPRDPAAEFEVQDLPERAATPDESNAVKGGMTMSPTTPIPVPYPNDPKRIRTIIPCV